ncbi:hypothetical protein [Thermodesulfovibrio sp. TK110]
MRTFIFIILVMTFLAYHAEAKKCIDSEKETAIIGKEIPLG